MTKTLRFDGTERDATRFKLLYQGFIAGGNQQERKGMEIVRREAKILDLLDPISTPAPENPDVFRVLAGSAPQEVTFDAPQFDMILRYVEAVSWTTQMARQAVDMIDWLRAVQPDPEAG